MTDGPTREVLVESVDDVARVKFLDLHPAGDVTITTYWHTDDDGAYLVVEIDALNSSGPRGEPTTPIRVRHNEAVVYDWKVSPTETPYDPHGGEKHRFYEEN